MDAKGKLIAFKGKPQKITKSRTDTISFTADEVKDWAVPKEIQRPLTFNRAFNEVVEYIRESGGVIPGIITFAIIDGKTYRLDGNHRITAFLQSGCERGYADVRYVYCDSMADAGEEFRRLNKPIARMKPDDILRALQPSIPAIAKLREKCPVVGYSPRKGKGKSAVSMSMILRAWRASGKDTPANHGVADSGDVIVSTLGDEELDHLITFINLAAAAWGNERESMRLWCSLNVTMCMWLYRRIVMSRYSIKSAQIDREMFGKCLMELSADGQHADWLVGRGFAERNRTPCYNRIKDIFVRRLHRETGKKVHLPAPDWNKQ